MTLSLHRKKDGDDSAALRQFLEAARDRHPEAGFRLGVTGIEAARLPDDRIHSANGILAIARRFHQSIARLNLADLLVDGGIALRRDVQQWRVRRVVGERIARPDEPGYLDMKKLTAPDMPNEAHELLFINVAKIVDFARRGADGIINAICFNCMVGNASAAVIEKIRRDYHNLPIITAVSSGGEDPSRRMVLEAFVSQVKAHYGRRSYSQE